MDRSLYPSSVEVDQPTLDNTEATKAYHIKQRWMDAGNSGIADGCAVTVSANPIQVDVAAGRAYAPNNELIIVPETGGLGLSVYTAGTRNYVCAVYGEEESRPAARAFDGRTSNTRVQGTARLRVFSKAELDALPLTHTDMSVDARDRTVVLAVVTANGTAVPLTGASIETPPPVFTALVGLDQPQTITGVVFTAIDQETTLTEDATATLLARLLYTPGATPPSTATLSWRMPDDTYGAAVPIPADGEYTLATDDGQTVTVQVYTNQLPLTPSVNVEEDFEIYDVYGAERFSAADLLHRARTGTLAASRNNPHGQRVGDLGDPVADIAHTVRVGGGLVDTAAQAQVPRLTGPQNTNDLYNLWWETPLEFSGNARTIRVYSISVGGLCVAMNARWDGTNWNKDEAADIAARVSLGVAAQGGIFRVETREAASAAAWNDTQWSTNGITSQHTDTRMLLPLLLGPMLTNDANPLTQKLSINFNTTGRTLLFTSALASLFPGASILRVYRAVAPLTGGAHALEFVLNAAWTGTEWARDAADAAVKLTISRDEVSVYSRLAASSSPFTDATGSGGWDGEPAGGSPSFGNWEIGNDFTVGGDFIWSPPKTMTKSIPGLAGVFSDPTVTFYQPQVAIGTAFVGIHKQVGASADTLFLPVELPDGAVITGVTIVGLFDNNAGTITASALRYNITSSVMQSLNSGGAEAVSDGALNTQQALTINQFQTVDNSTYNYGVWIRVSAAAEVQLQGAIVAYTMSLLRTP